MKSSPVGEAVSPGMMSSPDTRAFSGRRCITEASGGCFFTTQSKWAPSITFKRLQSAKRQQIYDDYSHTFHDNKQTLLLNTNELDMIFLSAIIMSPPKNRLSISLVSDCNIPHQQQGVTWYYGTQNADTSIFQYPIWLLVT